MENINTMNWEEIDGKLEANFKFKSQTELAEFILKIAQYADKINHHPELIIVEVLDDENKPVKEGEIGELTITTIGVEAMPLIRFKTGDIVKLHTDSCSCGRNTLRIGPVVGRKQQMIKYKGTTLYPPAMNDLLNNFENIDNYLIQIYTNDLGTDEIVIKIVVKVPNDKFLIEVKDHFRAKLRVTPKIEFVSKEILNPIVFNPMNRKPIRFIDTRK